MCVCEVGRGWLLLGIQHTLKQEVNYENSHPERIDPMDTWQTCTMYNYAYTSISHTKTVYMYYVCTLYKVHCPIHLA